MTQPQPGIIEENRQFALFLVANVRDPKNNAFKAAQRFASFFPLAAELQNTGPGSKVTGTVSFGSSIWDFLSSRKKPSRLRSFKAVEAGARTAPATGGDILVHISSNRFDLNFELARRLCLGMADVIEVLDEVHGFTYLDSRDLTGFIDGTANPKMEERAGVALIGKEDEDFQGGSYVLTQKYAHNLDQWQKLSQRQQEEIIGRSRPDSAELPEAEKPRTAHISRVEIKEQGEELKIVRHSYPYGKATGEAGLFFIAYARDPDIFEKMLNRMYGVSGDGLHDRLMDYTRPLTGAIFFTPPLEVLDSFR